jgi:hypothetical protein
MIAACVCPPRYIQAIAGEILDQATTPSSSSRGSPPALAELAELGPAKPGRLSQVSVILGRFPCHAGIPARWVRLSMAAW